MAVTLATIGFGEAARVFASVAVPHATLHAYDRKTDDPATAPDMRAACAAAGVMAADTVAAAVDHADAVLSLVTADQALAAAEAAVRHLSPGTLWLDCNSVAPQTKRAAAALIERIGGCYVDVAIMAPVHPAGSSMPMLISGPHARAATDMLARIGFSQIRSVSGPVGRASSIKMIRSVIVKGIEALTAECVLAAAAADVLDDVMDSLDAAPPPTPWRMRAEYNLERMMTHGLRRAAEMDEAVKTLDALGTGSVMTRGTAEWQRLIGESGCNGAPAGLNARIAALQAALPSGRSTAASSTFA